MARRKPPIQSRDLGIDLASGRERDLFRWFLACLLFGKPIQQEVARRAYVEFVRERLVTPEAIVDAGWDKLVEMLDRGHYVRYDFSALASPMLSRIAEETHRMDSPEDRALRRAVASGLP